MKLIQYRLLPLSSLSLVLLMLAIASTLNLAIGNSASAEVGKASKVQVTPSAKVQAASTQLEEDLSSLIDQLDAADKADFDERIYKMRSCTIRRDFSCSRSQYKDAKLYAHSKKDAASLTTAYNELQDEIKRVAAEEAAAIAAQARLEEAESEREDRRAQQEASARRAIEDQERINTYNATMQAIQNAGRDVSQYIRSSGMQVMQAQQQAQRINQRRQDDANERAYERENDRIRQQRSQLEREQQTRLAALSASGPAAGGAQPAGSNSQAFLRKQQRDDALRRQQEEDQKLAAIKTNGNSGLPSGKTPGSVPSVVNPNGNPSSPDRPTNLTDLLDQGVCRYEIRHEKGGESLPLEKEGQEQETCTALKREVEKMAELPFLGSGCQSIKLWESLSAGQCTCTPFFKGMGLNFPKCKITYEGNLRQPVTDNRRGGGGVSK
jgi:hypothetical protein